MYKDLIEKMNETIDAIATLQAQIAGRSTPIEDFPEDGLHPATERVIAEYLAEKGTLLSKLEHLTSSWKAHQTPPTNIPLAWRIDRDGLLFLDDVFIAPVSQIGEIDLHDFDEYNIGIPFTDGRAEIIIVRSDEGPHRIERIEREIR